MYWMQYLNVNNTQKNKELKNEMLLGGCFSVKKFSGQFIFSITETACKVCVFIRKYVTIFEIFDSLRFHEKKTARALGVQG